MTNQKKTLHMNTVYSYAVSYEAATGIRCADRFKGKRVTSRKYSL